MAPADTFPDTGPGGCSLEVPLRVDRAPEPPNAPCVPQRMRQWTDRVGPSQTSGISLACPSVVGRCSAAQALHPLPSADADVRPDGWFGGVVGSKNRQTTAQQPAQPPVRQLLGTANAQMAPAATGAAPVHQRRGSANVETTPTGAPAMRREERVTVLGPVKETATRRTHTQGGGGMIPRKAVHHSARVGGWGVASSGACWNTLM